MKRVVNYPYIMNMNSVVFASLIPNVFLIVLPSIFSENMSFSNIAISGIFFLLAFSISFLHITLVGFPLLYLIAKRTQITLLIMLFTGGLAGVLPYCVLILLSFISFSISAIKDLFFLFGALFAYGAFSSFVYWYAFILNEKFLKRLDSPDATPPG